MLKMVNVMAQAMKRNRVIAEGNRKYYFAHIDLTGNEPTFTQVTL